MLRTRKADNNSLSHSMGRADIGDELCLQPEDAHLYAEDIHLYAKDVYRQSQDKP